MPEDDITLAVVVAIVVAVIAAVLYGCHASSYPPTPRLWLWPKRSFPIHVWVSRDLEPCQIAGTHAAIAWLESRTGNDLFAASELPGNDPVFRGRVPHGVIVRPLIGDDDNVRGRARAIWMDESKRLVYGVDVSLRGCSPRVAVHELAHAVGLAHSQDPQDVLWWAAKDSSWGFRECDLESIREHASQR